MGRGIQNLAVLSVFLVAFAGCSGEKPAATTTADHDHMDMDGNATLPVVGTVKAVITVTIGGNKTGPVNGSIPTKAGVNVTFDGSASEGPNLTFSWTLGDDGTATNATIVHAFAKPGNYTVTLAVTSGNATDNETVKVAVAAGGPAPGTLVWTDKKTFTGTLTLGNPNSAMNAGIDYNDHVVELFPVDPNGTTVKAKTVRLSLDGGGGAVSMYLYWISPKGTTLATAGGNNAADQTLKYEGDMPAGKYVARVRLFAGAQATYTLKSEVDYVAT